MPLAPPVIKIVLLVSFIIKYLGGQSARERRCGLDSKPFINQVRFDFPRKRSGHEGVQDAVQPAWNDLERFLRRLLRASDTHCSTLIGFIGMVFGSRPNLSSTAVFVNPAASTVT